MKVKPKLKLYAQDFQTAMQGAHVQQQSLKYYQVNVSNKTTVQHTKQ